MDTSTDQRPQAGSWESLIVLVVALAVAGAGFGWSCWVRSWCISDGTCASPSGRAGACAVLVRDGGAPPFRPALPQLDDEHEPAGAHARRVRRGRAAAPVDHQRHGDVHASPSVPKRARRGGHGSERGLGPHEGVRRVDPWHRGARGRVQLARRVPRVRRRRRARRRRAARRGGAVRRRAARHDQPGQIPRRVPADRFGRDGGRARGGRARVRAPGERGGRRRRGRRRRRARVAGGTDWFLLRRKRAIRLGARVRRLRHLGAPRRRVQQLRARRRARGRARGRRAAGGGGGGQRVGERQRDELARGHDGRAAHGAARGHAAAGVGGQPSPT